MENELDEIEKKIKTEETALSLMYKFKDITGESDEEFWKKFDYRLDYLIPLYKKRAELKKQK